MLSTARLIVYGGPRVTPRGLQLETGGCGRRRALSPYLARPSCEALRHVRLRVTMLTRSRTLLLLTLVAAGALAVAVHATEPDAATSGWWEHVKVLASDQMRGRAPGTPEHRRAQEYVARQFEQAGVSPAGDSGYFQTVPIHSYRLQPERSTASISRNGRVRQLRWLEHVAVAPARGLPASVSGRLVFVGSDGSNVDTTGAVVVRLNPVRYVAGPAQPAPPPMAAAVLGIDSTEGPEPMRWPSQYGLTNVPGGTPIPTAQGVPVFRFNPAFADVLLEGSGHTYRELVALAAAGRPVPSFTMQGSVTLTPVFAESEFPSDNVIGMVRGSDPALSSQYVVLGAHIDAYGVAAPWGSDSIYNGAFDDAAYVATLIEFAKRLRASGTRLRRSLVFASFTAEESGHLGSLFYASHPNVPRGQLVANVNLDQLRPLFPLNTLTMHGVDDSTLGDIARQVAGSLGITVQPDPEPLRTLVRRGDNLSFLQIGVPAAGFVFGYTPGSRDEAAVRQWYKDRYHTPRDDLSQPWVPEAAARFNEFFARFVTAIANANEAPRWKAGSEFAPRGQR